MDLLVGSLVSAMLILGALFSLIAAVGIVRFPDVLLRMHASTKAGTLGAGLIFGAAAVSFGDSSSIAFALLTVLFLMITMPVSAHAIGRAAYKAGVPLWCVECDERPKMEPPPPS